MNAFSHILGAGSVIVMAITMNSRRIGVRDWQWWACMGSLAAAHFSGSLHV
jgi:hypothetical protein